MIKWHKNKKTFPKVQLSKFLHEISHFGKKLNFWKFKN